MALLTRIDRGIFGERSLKTWPDAGVDIHGVELSDQPAGAAFFFVD